MPACCPPSLELSTLEPRSGSGDIRARHWLRLGIAALLASQTMVLSLAVNLSPIVQPTRFYLHILLATLTVGVFLFAGLPLAREAWIALSRRRIVIEQLFLLGILGAFVASVTSSITGQGSIYYEVVSILVGIYMFGKLMAIQRQEHVERASFQLAQKHQSCVRIAAGGNTEEVSAEQIEVGDRIVVGPGSSISVDGQVVEGVGYVRETSLTGEPFPVVKRPGDRVLAGSEMVDATLTIAASVPGDRRQLDLLLKEISEARTRPSTTQREADRLMAWFLPIVISVSVLTFILCIRSLPWTVALFRSMSVLLVACPCAMGLATPIAVWGALNALVRKGWRVKSPEFIERLAAVDTVVFDKTGTLSQESLKLIDFVTTDLYSRDLLLSWVGELQRQSNHPVARAFHGVTADAARLASGFQIHDIAAIPAVGLKAQLASGDSTSNSSLLLEIGNGDLLSPENVAIATALRAQTNSVTSTHEVWIRINGALCGLALLAECLRETALQAIDRLQRLGIAVQIMTGDTTESAQRLGIQGAQASLTPLEKAQRVKSLQDEGHHVLFIGDGLNDSAALASAHASLTPLHASTVAQAASQALMHLPNLATIPEAIQIARRTITGIRRNLIFAAIYNLSGMALAATGLLHPVAAALLMLVASATVTSRAIYFAENIQPMETRRKEQFKTGTLSSFYTHFNVVSIIIALGFCVQGFVLSYLGRDDGTWRATLELIGLALGALTLLFWPFIYRFPSIQMGVGMLSVGNLGMLIGWWSDAGFSPIVLNKIARSCCLQVSGNGAFHLHFSLMQLGMLLSSLPLMMVINDPTFRLFRSLIGKCLHGMVGSVGMLLGMWAAAAVFSVVPMLQARLYFHLYYVAMSLGMLLGMFAFCAVWRLAARTRLFSMLPGSYPPRVPIHS